MNRRAWWSAIWGALCVLITVGGLLTQPRLSAIPQSSLQRLRQLPLQLHGRRLDGVAELAFDTQRLPSSAVVAVQSPHGTQQIALARRVTPLHLWLNGVECVLFCLVAFIICWPRRATSPGAQLYSGTLLFAVAVGTGHAYLVPHPLSVDGALIACFFASRAFLPLLFLHLSLSFPAPHRAASSWRFRMAAAAAVIGLTGWEAATWWQYCLAPSIPLWRAYFLAHLSGDLWTATILTAGLVILAVRSARFPEPQLRLQSRWLLLSMSLGVAPPLLLRVIPRALGLAEPLPAIVDRALELAVPLALGFSVLVHQTMDIDAILRRGVISTILALVAFGTGVTLWLSMASTTGTILLSPLAAWALVAAVALATFPALRRIIGRWLDASVFRLERDLTASRTRFHTACRAAYAPQVLAAALSAAAREAFKAQKIHVRVRLGEDETEEGDAAWRAATTLLDHTAAPGSPVPHPPGDASDARSDGASRVYFRREAGPGDGWSPVLPAACVAEGVHAAWHLSAPDGSSVVLCLGAKASMRAYVAEDAAFLDALRLPLEEALGRIALERQMAEESLARRRLDELDRMKSDFLGHAAHDLRTPVTSISWATRNLLDGVRGPLTPPQQEYVNAIHTAAGQLERLVRNLLEISRMEAGQAAFACHPVDLEECVRAVLESLRPAADMRSVTLAFDSPPDLPPVRAHMDRLPDVVFNLGGNALKFTAPGSAVSFTIRREAAGIQALAVRDQGPGVPDAERDEIFGRFRQGAARGSGSERGFGLGLHVVRSYMQAFGGDVSASTPDGGGALFTCRLHEWTDEEKDRH